MHSHSFEKEKKENEKKMFYSFTHALSLKKIKKIEFGASIHALPFKKF